MIGKDIDGFISDVLKIGVDHLLGSLDYDAIQEEMKTYEKSVMDLRPNSDGDKIAIGGLSVDLEMLAFLTLHDSGLFPVYLMLILTSDALKQVFIRMGMEDKESGILARSFVTCFYYISSTKYNELCKDSKDTYVNRFVTVLGSCGLFKTTYNTELTDSVIKMFGRSLTKGELTDEED